MRVLEHWRELDGEGESDGSCDMDRGVRQDSGRREHDVQEATGDLNQELRFVESLLEVKTKIANGYKGFDTMLEQIYETLSYIHLRKITNI